MGDDERNGTDGENQGEGQEPSVPDYNDGNVIKNKFSELFSANGRTSQRRMAEAGGGEQQESQEAGSDEHIDSMTVMDFSDTVIKRQEQPSQRRIVEGRRDDEEEPER
jgi:hypothetical protein